MIVNDSFSRLTTRMIVDDSFSVSCHPTKQAGSFKKWPPQANRACRRNQIFRLIDEYEARTCLWNIFSDDYHNRCYFECVERVECEFKLRTEYRKNDGTVGIDKLEFLP